MSSAQRSALSIIGSQFYLTAKLRFKYVHSVDLRSCNIQYRSRRLSPNDFINAGFHAPGNSPASITRG
jgi:hypothetical protein